ERGRAAPALEDLPQDLHGPDAGGGCGTAHQRPNRPGTLTPRANSAPPTGLRPARWSRRRLTERPSPAAASRAPVSVQDVPGGPAPAAGKGSRASSLTLSPSRNV